MSLMLRAFLTLSLGVIFDLPAGASAQMQRALGTDVASWESNTIDWAATKNAGVVFAWSKATEGTYYVNPWFTNQVSGARAVGIPIGAYHYAVPSADTNITGTNSADSEAAYFWNVAGSFVKDGRGSLVPMLDWEDPAATNGHDGYQGVFTKTRMSAWVNEWCGAVSNEAAASGVILRPVVYTGTWYSNPTNRYPGLDSTVTNWPNWMANYNGKPAQVGFPTTAPWPSWDIWQYADTNWSGGDSDVYNSNYASFLQIFAVGGTNAPCQRENTLNTTP